MPAGLLLRTFSILGTGEKLIPGVAGKSMRRACKSDATTGSFSVQLPAAMQRLRASALCFMPTSGSGRRSGCQNFSYSSEIHPS